MLQKVEPAYAKLTVYLHMTGVREDGYHLIDAEMVTLNLYDTLTLSIGDGLDVFGEESEGVPNDESNLISKVLHLTQKSAYVRLEKRIPHGGGLGGGSADAAAVLRWARELDLLQAAKIGADVPFCLRGGRARVQGIGEIVEPLPFIERTYTLLMPPFGVNTAAVYKAFDELDREGKARTSDRNHLEAAAIAVEPRLSAWRDRLRDFTGAEPVLTGSGSTWFVEGKFEMPAQHDLAGGKWFVANAVPAIAI